MLWPHPACLSDEALLAQCEIGFGRTSGPGGQHRNKVQTLVKLLHTPTGIESHAGERRSQVDNKRVALRRLRLLLAIHTRTPVPAGEIGSELWKSRRRAAPRGHEGGKSPLGRFRGGGTGYIVINPDHHDYPALLAEAMDVIAACGWEPKQASLRLDCSASQLVKLIAAHPAAMVELNAVRGKLGLRTLRVGD
jgi:hypothetical protein